MVCFYKKQNGFSLIELVVVCLLISTLLGIGIPAYMTSKYKADKQKGIFNLYAIYQTQKMYYFDQDPREYASHLDELSPAYAEFSQHDGTWTYFLNAGTDSYTARADHITTGNWIAIDETGSIDDSAWPY